MKNKKTRLLTTLILIAVLLVAAVLIYKRFGAGASSKQQNDFPAPDFSMSDESGKIGSLSDHQGRPVIINFWASWCGICTAEMPDFQLGYEKYSEKIDFIMLNCTDPSETKETALEYIKDKGFSFPIYFDDQNASARNAYHVSGIPVTAFITSKGEAFALHNGYLDSATFEEYVGQLLEYEEGLK